MATVRKTLSEYETWHSISLQGTEQHEDIKHIRLS